MDREAWSAAIHGVAKSWTRLSDWTELIRTSYDSIAKNSNNLIKEWAEDLNEYFSKEGILMANKYKMKKCSTIPIIKKIQIKTIIICLLTHIRIAIIKKQPNKKTKRNNKCWWGCGEKATLVHCWWECKLVQPLWKTVWRFFQKLKTVTILFSNLTSGYIAKENEIIILKRNQHPYILYSMIHYSHDMETTQVSISE